MNECKPLIMGIDHSLFEREIAALKREVGVANDNELTEVTRCRLKR